MTETKYPLAESSWGEEEIRALHAVIASGQYSLGPFVATFEREFAAFTGSRYCVMVNSGSSANLLAVAALFYTRRPRLRAGDEVIVPAVSWSTTYYPLLQYNLKVKFVDIDRETLNFDLDALAGAVGDRTKAVLAVNLLGNPNDFDAVCRLLAGRGVVLLEDNCESLGATFAGKQAGTFGVMGTFSTFFSHHMSTMEGGMIVTDDEELYHILLSLRAHGWTRNLPKTNRVTGTKSDDAFKESFKFVLPGYNVRPIEMFGAVGSEQLKKLPGFIQARRDNAALFKNLMGDFDFLQTQKEIGDSSWFGFSLLLKENGPLDRDRLVSVLQDSGIDCRPIVAGNFVANPVIDYFDYSQAGALTNAEYVDRNGLFVGNHHFDLSEPLNYLHAVLSGLG